jgi:3-methyl-2-oxobutanoate hydroxymethyltransferase
MPVHDCGTSQASGPPVLEAVPAAVTELLAPLMTCVVIGIGAGGATDGQVLVWHDLLGLSTGHVAKFVQRFADLRTDAVRRAVQRTPML